jgi:hypothetical protein
MTQRKLSPYLRSAGSDIDFQWVCRVLPLLCSQTMSPGLDHFAVHYLSCRPSACQPDGTSPQAQFSDLLLVELIPFSPDVILTALCTNLETGANILLEDPYRYILVSVMESLAYLSQYRLLRLGCPGATVLGCRLSLHQCLFPHLLLPVPARLSRRNAGYLGGPCEVLCIWAH